ncbi:hypothetical protein AAG570_013278 [Ranatra chinensis]|uniref:RNA-directed DNA polymerase n=1 Tax=Ranatra chinensis TaxID=642074 RepID=A0ABD0YGC1_9HEMI
MSHHLGKSLWLHVWPLTARLGRNALADLSEGLSVRSYLGAPRCADANPCAQVCTDMENGISCSCNQGYSLNLDNITCHKIDDKVDIQNACPIGYKYNQLTGVCHVRVEEPHKSSDVVQCTRRQQIHYIKSYCNCPPSGTERNIVVGENSSSTCSKSRVTLATCRPAECRKKSEKKNVNSRKEARGAPSDACVGGGCSRELSGHCSRFCGASLRGHTTAPGAQGQASANQFLSSTSNGFRLFTDIDECEKMKGACERPDERCVNIVGGFKCVKMEPSRAGGTCPEGHKYDPASAGCTEAIKELQEPVDVKGVRSIVGLVGYYRRFHPSLADRLEGWSSLTKKGAKFVITEDMREALEWAKTQLCEDPVLRFPNISLPFVIPTNATQVAVGASSHRWSPDTQTDHGGIRETVAHLRRKYYWSGMERTVAAQLALCVVGARAKHVRIPKEPPQMVTPTPKKPLEADVIFLDGTIRLTNWYWKRKSDPRFVGPHVVASKLRQFSLRVRDSATRKMWLVHVRETRPPSARQRVPS